MREHAAVSVSVVSLGLGSRVVACLVLAALVTTIGVRTARAEGAINVASAGVQVNFPSGVTFTIDAASSAEIVDLTLQLNTPTQRYGGYTRNVRPDFRPGVRVTASWTWRRWGATLPPGAEVTYRWRIRDASGAEYETPLASVIVEDGRFTWRELREGPIVLRWYQGDESFGRTLLNEALDAVQRLSTAQGVDLQSPVTVHVYGSQQELYQALPGVPPWIGGISIGEFDTVMLPATPRNMSESRRTLAHELAHQLIYQQTFNPSLGSKMPAWLNEGLAVVAEGVTTNANRRALDEARDREDRGEDALPTLRSLSTGFSGLPSAQAQLAYAASESVVRYLLAAEGAEKMRALLVQFRDGRTADDALLQVYGYGVDEAEGRWRRSLGLAPRDRGGEGPRLAPEPSAATAADARTAPPWLALAGGLLLGLALVVAVTGGLFLARRRGT